MHGRSICFSIHSFAPQQPVSPQHGCFSIHGPDKYPRFSKPQLYMHGRRSVEANILGRSPHSRQSPPCRKNPSSTNIQSKRLDAAKNPHNFRYPSPPNQPPHNPTPIISPSILTLLHLSPSPPRPSPRLPRPPALPLKPRNPNPLTRTPRTPHPNHPRPPKRHSRLAKRPLGEKPAKRNRSAHPRRVAQA